jgi:hypothetical protein
MEGAAVSLSPWERQILSRIAQELTGADPKLASFLTGFNRLAAGEEMPARLPLRSARRSRGRVRYGRRSRHSARAAWFFVAAWFFATTGMIAIALVMNVLGPRASDRGCAQPRAVSCTGKGLGALAVLSPGSSS